ncbi:MAG: hypothetical protein AAGH64_08575 [Planctomycetota bacterium]
MKPASEMSQDEINRYCGAASATYYAIVCAHAQRTGVCAKLPDLLCPDGIPPMQSDYTNDELDEAEAFLLRLGVISDAV